MMENCGDFLEWIQFLGGIVRFSEGASGSNFFFFFRVGKLPGSDDGEHG
jgi:hypothetical protein